MKRKSFIVFFSFVLVLMAYVTISQNIVASETVTCSDMGCYGASGCMQRPRGNIFCILIDCNGPRQHFQCPHER